MFSRARLIFGVAPASLRDLSYTGRLGIWAGYAAEQLSQPAPINRLPLEGRYF